MTWTNELLEDAAQVDLAAMMARNWGFPREITPNELEHGVWFAMFRGCELSLVWWLEIVQGKPSDAGLHYAIASHVRRRWPARAWLEEVIPTAREMGIERLHAWVEGEILNYVLRYVGIWNRRHQERLTVLSAREVAGRTALAIRIGGHVWD